MNKTSLISLIGGVVIIVVIVIVAAKYNAANNPSLNSSANTQDQNQNQTETPNTDKVQIEDIVVGEGAEIQNGQTAVVHYVGTLTNGTQFDSSRDRGTPFEFVLGTGNVIQGWHEGVAGMRVGGKRKLTIPPSLGYGNMAQGDIPANSTLVFEIELLDIK